MSSARGVKAGTKRGKYKTKKSLNEADTTKDNNLVPLNDAENIIVLDRETILSNEVSELTALTLALEKERLKVKRLKDAKQTSDILIFDLRNSVVGGNAKNTKLKKTLKDREVQIIEREKEIVKLKESLAYEKGQIEVYQKSKPQIVNNNKNCAVNSKLSHIQISTIKPFTIEHISELLPQYTEDRFRNKLAGIVTLILPFTTLNVKGVTERNIVCTDLARSKCHVLNVDREWERDDGLTICADIIKLFLPKMKEYMNVYDEKFEEANKHVNAESHSIVKTSFYAKHRQDFDYYFELIEDIRLGFYAPATRGSGDDYDTLVRKFRDALKPTIYMERPKKD